MGIDFLNRLEYDTLCEMLIPQKKDIVDAWVIGGSLLRQDSKDIDVLVKIRNYDSNVHFYNGIYSVGSIYERYSAIDKSKDRIIKLTPTLEYTYKARPVDLLIVSDQMPGNDISRYMRDVFPLDIQEVSHSIFTGINIGVIRRDPAIIQVKKWVSRYSTIDKYKKYYPNAKFFQEV